MALPQPQQPSYAEIRRAALAHLTAARELLAKECEPGPTSGEDESRRFAMMLITRAKVTLAP